MERLVEALRPDGMQSKEAKILMQLLDKWDLQHPFNASDEEVVKDLVGYWGLGSNGVSLGLRPRDALWELAQASLDARMPNELKFELHSQPIARA
ncbi:base excision DNA repair protein [Colletotrichum abscissum]